MNTHSQEVSRGERYGFGKNWKRFLRTMDEERVHEAERSLREMLQMETMAGKSLLDAGSGSGLFSLAAMRLGADRVHSFDYDPHSVACTKELKRRFFPQTDKWTIEVPHKTAHQSGSPGLFGFSPQDMRVYIDNVSVTPN